MPRTLQEKLNLILEATIASLEPNLSWQDLDAQYQNQARKRKKFRKALYEAVKANKDSEQIIAAYMVDLNNLMIKEERKYNFLYTNYRNRLGDVDYSKDIASIGLAAPSALDCGKATNSNKTSIGSTTASDCGKVTNVAPKEGRVAIGSAVTASSDRLDRKRSERIGEPGVPTCKIPKTRHDIKLASNDGMDLYPEPNHPDQPSNRPLDSVVGSDRFIPDLPDSDSCVWTFDEKQRILRGDFTSCKESEISKDDKEFCLRMLEHTDLLLVLKGLFVPSPEAAFFFGESYMETTVGHRFFTLKRFEAIFVEQEIVGTMESDKDVTMTMRDFLRYLRLRNELLGDSETPSQELSERNTAEMTYRYSNDEGTEVINVLNEILYMTDVDIEELLPGLNRAFKENFRFPDILPGGPACFMEPVRWMVRLSKLSVLSAHLYDLTFALETYSSAQRSRPKWVRFCIGHLPPVLQPYIWTAGERAIVAIFASVATMRYSWWKG